MKRAEKIFAYIKEKSAACRREDLTGTVGCDAQEIADALGILRNNVSKELNELHRLDLVVKFKKRPVRYFAREALETLLEAKLPQGPLSYQEAEECTAGLIETASPFSTLIGEKGSLARQVEQAKAAILYPPDGLHTIIVGQTGVGKTLFAHLMFRYGKAVHRFSEDAPFVTFNCADYYNNPQLLISHIFGHQKGAFTGADSAKAGLVEQADGGVLFLDEIHRLPPEGQEMIFYFMDTGTFSRLGETSRSRHAKVLIIGATTEDPDSVLTKTFVRRIPNFIKIPALSERTISEQLDILKLLFTEEAQRVKKPVRVTVEAVKALIGSIGSGNVGQLKSNIKLLCAQAFLNGIDNPSFIEVEFKMLPEGVKDGLLTLSADRQALAELVRYVPEPLLITPTGGENLTPEEGASSFNLYQVVADRVALLKNEGISAELIKQIVATDVNVYVKKFYDKKRSVNMTTRERLLKIVDASLVDFAEEIALFVQKRLNRSYRDRFLYAFSLHLSAFLKRAKAKETVPYMPIEGAAQQGSPCLEVALEIGSRIERHYKLTVPRVEIDYIALLLESSEDEELGESIVIVVATHGVSTATSMVEVAQKLFDSSSVEVLAVDMPLETAPQEILEKTAARLKAVDCRQGVLLLADMGSLCNIGHLLAAELKVPVRTIDMVSTPLVLEAMRKSDIADVDLDTVYESLLGFKGYESVDVASERSDERPECIVTICSTGRGTAVKLQELVEALLARLGRTLEVIPLGLTRLEPQMEEIMKEKRILAAVGVKRPALAVPFVPLEDLIDGAGEGRLTELLLGGHGTIAPARGAAVVEKLVEESLLKFLTYLNPAKIMGALLRFDEMLEAELKLKLTNPLRIRLLVHCGCALERAVMRSPLVFQEEQSEVDAAKLAALRKAAAVFEEGLKLALADDELCFMARMI